jgi:hypothetical protein
MWTMPQLPPELLAQLSRGNGAPGPLPMDPTGSDVGVHNTSNAALGGAQPAAQPAALSPMIGPPKPIQMGPGGRNLNPPPPTDPSASPGGMVAGANIPGASPFTRTAPPPPQSSDDRGITGMPELPTLPDYSNNPVSQAYSRYQDLEKKRAAVPLPDPQKLKPKWWERLAGAGVGFASGWGDAARGAQLGGDVTTRRYDAAMRDYTHQTGALDKQLETERGGFPLAEAAAKMPQQAYENAVQRTRLGTEQQVAKSNIQNRLDLTDIKQQMADLANTKASDQKEMALNKLSQDLELRSKGLDLKQMSLDQQRQFNELSNQLKEQKLESDRAKFSTGTDAKSLEDERKARLTSIENDWKQHPYWNKLTGDKNKEVQAVNDDINQRLSGVRQAGGLPASAGSATTPVPQTHSWSKSAWAKANPGRDAATAERMATRQGFQVVP